MRFISDHKQNWLRWLPAIIFAVAIFLFSSIPGEKVDDLFGRLRFILLTIPLESWLLRLFFSRIEWLKVGHGIGYFCFGCMVLHSLNTRTRWSPLLALGICSLCAIVDELHQAFIPGRSPGVRDIMLDSLASLAGVLITLGIVKWRDGRTSGEVRASLDRAT